MILFHIGHVGYLPKILVQCLIENLDDVYFLVDIAKVPSRNINMIKKINANVITYSETIFWHGTYSVEESEEKILLFFDCLFEHNGLSISAFSKIYNTFDDRNAFGSYLSLKKIKFSIITTNSDALRDYIYQQHINSDSHKYYGLTMLKHRSLSIDAEFCENVLYYGCDERILKFPNVCKCSFVDNLCLLNENQKKILISKYPFPYEPVKKYFLLILRSYSCVDASIHKLDSAPARYKFAYPYALLLDMTVGNGFDVMIKAHPNYELEDDLLKLYFTNDNYIPGYIPSDILSIYPYFNIATICNIGSSSKIYCNASCISIGNESAYFNNYMSFYKYYSAIQYLLECGIFNIYIENEIWSKDLCEILLFRSAIHLVPFNDADGVILDDCSKKDEDRITIVMDNPTNSSRESGIRYYIVKIIDDVKAQDLVSDLDKCDSFIVFNSQLNSWHYSKKLSRCGVTINVSSINPKSVLKNNLYVDLNHSDLYGCHFNPEYYYEQGANEHNNEGNDIPKDIWIAALLGSKKALNRICNTVKMPILYHIAEKKGISESLVGYANYLFDNNCDCCKSFINSLLDCFFNGNTNAFYILEKICIKYSVNEIFDTLEKLSVINYNKNTSKTVCVAFDIIRKKGSTHFKIYENIVETMICLSTPSSIVRVAIAYQKGICTNQDLIKSSFYMEKAWKCGIEWAKYSLCDILWELGGNENNSKVMQILNESVQNDVRTMVYLSKAYHYGRGVTRNEDVAVEYKKKAIALGYHKLIYD